MIDEMLRNRISMIFLISSHTDTQTHIHTFIELTVSVSVVCDYVSQGLVRKLKVNVMKTAVLYCTV